MKQIFHPYTDWEDWKNGMWRKVPRKEEEELLPIAIQFTGDHELYGAAMRKVIKEWKFSCEHNLTDLGQNRKAWIGHAACSLELNLPEYIVREAWGHLTDEQRTKANNQAELAILEWGKQNKETCQRLF